MIQSSVSHFELTGLNFLFWAWAAAASLGVWLTWPGESGSAGSDWVSSFTVLKFCSGLLFSELASVSSYIVHHCILKRNLMPFAHMISVSSPFLKFLLLYPITEGKLPKRSLHCVADQDHNQDQMVATGVVSCLAWAFASFVVGWDIQITCNSTYTYNCGKLCS